MGGQQRYVRDLHRRIQRSINVAVVRPQPIGLTPAEIDEEHNRVVIAEQPIPVRSHVRFYEAAIYTEAEAIAWTNRAVKLRFTTVEGAHTKCGSGPPPSTDSEQNVKGTAAPALVDLTRLA